MMAGNVHELRPKAGDSEKITVNLGYVDLGHIDLMVQEGFYANRTDLEAARKAGEMLHIRVLGLASIAADVTPELARSTIASVTVLGALHASPAVKSALADRIG